MEITYHYPPELFNLLVDTLPLLCKSKEDLILLIRGAGVKPEVYTDLQARLKQNRKSVGKYEIARTVLTRLNDEGEGALGERRELLRRVVEFEDFSTCWPNDQLKAKGLTSEIRRVVNVKDSFTRMNIERNKEVEQRKRKTEDEQRQAADARKAKSSIREDLFALFAESNAPQRGTKFEEVLNRLFKLDGLLVRESFRMFPDKGPGVLEQIDGVIELEGQLYLVEMKWLSKPIDVDDVSRHLVRTYHRGSVRGLFVSYTAFTNAALATCVEALQRTVISLCLLEEIVTLLESDGDLKAFLKKKVTAAVIEKQPFVRVT